MMRFIWAAALKDLRRNRRDLPALSLWLGIPVVVGALMSLALGGRGGGATPQARLLVADEDRSFMSRLLLGAFQQGRLATLVRVETVDPEEGRARIDGGQGSALLVIPAGFGAAVLEEEPAALTLLTNPAQRILPRIVEEILSIVTDAVFYVHRLLGEELRAMAAGPPGGGTTFPDSTVASLSVKVNRLAERAGAYLLPPRIDLETTVAEDESGEGESFGALLFPGLLVMSIFFIAQGLSGDVWSERAQGTLRRTAVAPPRIASLLAGKLLAAAVLTAAVGAAGFLAGAGLLGIELGTGKLLLALAWAVCSGVVLTALMMLIQLHASSQRGGSVLTSMLVFPLLMVGGIFFPFEAMPEWMARVGRRTPNGWALVQLEAILGGSTRAAELAAAFGVLAAAGALFFLLGARRLRRGFAAG